MLARDVCERPLSRVRLRARGFGRVQFISYGTVGIAVERLEP